VILPVELALRLRDNGLDFVVVGSTATWLRRGGRTPRDLDVVVQPADLRGLVAALGGVALSGPPLRRAADRTVDTTYGPLDVFFHRLRGAAASVSVAGRDLQVCGG
jgi:hypothetical protein